MLTAIIGISTIIVFTSITEAQLEQKTFVTHTGQVIKTSGDVLDPLYTVSTVEFDPMKYLREFHYGRISQLQDGTNLREFTIIAEDNKIQEISPGVFYNVWTFNGTVPGPTIRATEGDLVRIKNIVPPCSVLTKLDKSILLKDGIIPYYTAFEATAIFCIA